MCLSIKTAQASLSGDTIQMDVSHEGDINMCKVDIMNMYGLLNMVTHSDLICNASNHYKH